MPGPPRPPRGRLPLAAALSSLLLLLLPAPSSGAPVQALPWLWSGILGLSPACDQALAAFEARLGAKDLSAINALVVSLEAKIASGHVMESLMAYGQSRRQMASKPLADADKARYTVSFPWVSLGSPDACRRLDLPPAAPGTSSMGGFQGCLVDFMGPYMGFGLCAPAACTSKDVGIGLSATLATMMPTLPVDDPEAMAELQAKTECGYVGYPFTTATYVVVAVSLALLLLAVAGTGLDVARAAAAGRAKKAEEAEVVAGGKAGGGGRQQQREQEEEGTNKPVRAWEALLLCFSLPRHWRMLTAPGRGGAFDALDGLRALSMIWVVFGHTFIFTLMINGFSNLAPEVISKGNPSDSSGSSTTTSGNQTGFLATWGGQAVTGSYLAVDTFLFLSGFLAVALLVKAILRHQATTQQQAQQQQEEEEDEREGRTTTPRPARAKAIAGAAWVSINLYLKRYLRLTPAYAFVIFFYWHVLGAVGGEGPSWRAAFAGDYEVCSHIWWANFLYVNNFVTEPSSMGTPGMSCYPVSWYLAVDFQLFLLAPPVAFLAAWRPHLTLSLLALSTAASIAYTAARGSIEGWFFLMLGGGKGFNAYFTEYYITPWGRAPPFLIGMALAVVWMRLRSKEGAEAAANGEQAEGEDTGSSSGGSGSGSDDASQQSATASDASFPPPSSSSSHEHPPPRQPQQSRLSLLWRRCLRALAPWALALLLLASAAEAARGSYRAVPTPWPTTASTMYLAFSKPAWALGLALLSYRLFLGEGGPIKRLLEHRVMAIGARLTYCMYLVHPAVIYWFTAQQPGAVHFSGSWLATTYLGILAMTILVAAAVHLCVELPVASLLRLRLGRGRRQQRRREREGEEKGVKVVVKSLHGKGMGKGEEGEGEGEDDSVELCARVVGENEPEDGGEAKYADNAV